MLSSRTTGSCKPSLAEYFVFDVLIENRSVGVIFDIAGYITMQQMVPN